MLTQHKNGKTGCAAANLVFINNSHYLPLDILSKYLTSDLACFLLQEASKGTVDQDSNQTRPNQDNNSMLLHVVNAHMLSVKLSSDK